MGRAFLLRCGLCSAPDRRKFRRMPDCDRQGRQLGAKLPECGWRIWSLSWMAFRHGRGVLPIGNADPGRPYPRNELRSPRWGSSRLGRRHETRKDLPESLGLPSAEAHVEFACLTFHYLTRPVRPEPDEHLEVSRNSNALQTNRRVPLE